MSDLVRVQVLLEKRQRIELDEMAHKEGLSVSELIRTLLDSQIRERKYAEMRNAAKELKADYEAGGELSDMTSLDSEDFFNA